MCGVRQKIADTCCYIMFTSRSPPFRDTTPGFLVERTPSFGGQWSEVFLRIRGACTPHGILHAKMIKFILKSRFIICKEQILDHHFVIHNSLFLSRYSPSKDVSMITAKRTKKKCVPISNLSTAYMKVFTYIYFRDYEMKPIGLLIERFGVIAIEE